MKNQILLCLSFSWLFAFGQTHRIPSPNNIISLEFTVDNTGKPYYSLTYKNKEVIKKSGLGVKFSDGGIIDNLEMTHADTNSVNQTWNPVLGEVKSIRNQYNELIIKLKEKNNIPREVNIIFRVYDDGVGFRYEFPMQKNLSHFVVTDEFSQFNMTGNHKAWWIPADYDTNEYPYTTSLLSEVNAKKVSDKHTEIGTRVVKDESGVQTPLMMKTSDGLYINIHEAALVNYPAMQLHVDKSKFTLESRLVPDFSGNKAYLQTPFATPWRTIIISDKATEILSSKLILNLNEPCKIKDVSWIKPTKMIGIWWEMHIGTSTWDYAGTQDMHAWDNLSNLKPTGKHGATTEKTKKYIDFAAKHGFNGVLVEGWNVGWEDWSGKWKEEVFDFVTPYPDFNVKELSAYAASKKVKLIMHHETSGSVTNYERWMDQAYDFMKANGYDAVKTGYVGKIIPRGEHHDGQWMINHYNRVAAKTAAKKIMVDMHEPVRPTGMHRTYPNWVANEAARGNEFNAWSSGNPPEHETILPFTRLMGGPMDYTPGIFQIKLDKYGKKDNYVHTTLAKQLALYVTMYSPLHMAADLPENYEAHLDAFKFIKDVAMDWDDSRIIEAEPGDYITIARKAKRSKKWFVGSITDENSRTVSLPLDFLDKGSNYIISLYRDGDDAHWDTNPMSYKIEKFQVDASTVLKVNVAAGGGFAASLIPATQTNIKNVKKYE
jgi:glucan 1,4-alpha-glucosidase